MKPFHNVEGIHFSEEKMFIKIDAKQYVFNISEISQRLKKASQSERENFKISSSGYGIHWPAIDEDLSINGLLGIKHQPKSNKIAS